MKCGWITLGNFIIYFSGLLKNILFFFVRTTAFFISLKFMSRFPSCCWFPLWSQVTRIPQKLSRCGLHFTESFAGVFQLYSKNIFFFLVLVDSVYSDASWRIHPCTAVLAFLVPCSSPGCILHSRVCNSSRHKLFITEGKVNPDFLFSI